MKAIVRLLVLGGVFLVVGCSPRALYSWHDYEAYSYDYMKTRTPESKEKFMKRLEMLINRQTQYRKVPPPGACAEYGLLLIEEGRHDEGKAMLEKEIELYPESAVFVRHFLQRLQ